MTTASNADLRFRGCFTAVITPFTSDASSIDERRLQEQIALQAKGGVTGVVLAGTTGESPTLEHAEWHRLIELGTQLAHRHGILSVAGTGSNSTAHAVAMQREAAALGADAALSVNPYYNKPVQEGLYAHFMTQADAAALPVILYNIPGRTGVALAPDTVARLARHPNVRAIKEATGSLDSASEICARCPGLALLSGDDSLTLPFASVGGVGCVSVVSNVLPAAVSTMCRAFLAGRFDDALRTHRDLLGFARAMFVETNPIPVKAAMELLGLDSGAVRLPMTRATPATFDAVRRALASVEQLRAATSPAVATA
jgi:4-hydroxy-tetrahydrodipicolinate synthase